MKYTNVFSMTPCLYCMIVGAVLADNWPHFRGPNAGHAATSNIPNEFGPGNNELWSVDLERGLSSPIIWGDSIYLTSHVRDSKTVSVHSIDARNGKTKWKKDLDVLELERFSHGESSAASSSVATDGEKVIAFFGSSGVYCLNKEGSQLWHYAMKPSQSYGGSGCSPMIHDGLVYLQQYSRGRGFSLALDLVSGELKWKHEYPNRGAVMGPSGSGTAIVHNNHVIFHNTDGVAAHDLKSGAVIWFAQLNTEACSTPVVSGDHVYVATYAPTGETSLRPKPTPEWEGLLASNDKDGDGFISESEFPQGDIYYFARPEANSPGTSYQIGLSRVDRNRDKQVDEEEWTRFRTRFERGRAANTDHGLLAIKLGGTGDVSNSHVTVLENQGIPEVPSPVIDSNRVFIVKNGGILTCIDLDSNKRLFRKRIGSRGTHYASPIIVGKRMLVADGTGSIVIVDISGNRPVPVARNRIGDRIFATPAIVNNRLFVRTETKLHAFSK